MMLLTSKLRYHSISASPQIYQSKPLRDRLLNAASLNQIGPQKIVTEVFILKLFIQIFNFNDENLFLEDGL